MTAGAEAAIEKLGLVCRPNGLAWARTHCLGPFAQPLSPSTSQSTSQSIWRIHFASRDDRNRSHGAWAEFGVTDDGLSLLRFASRPSIAPGRLGAFDDAGALPASVVDHDGRLMMYYGGWTLGGTVPFHFFVGLALSADGGETFERVSEAPVLGRNQHDPYLAGAPWVLRDGGMFRMWYVSGTEWTADPAGGPNPVHRYTIKHAVSDDGVSWRTNDRLCLPYLDGEYAVARPAVVRSSGGYLMIYCARRFNETYRIYTATSGDGVSWTRSSEPLLGTGASGWDSEMVCYGSLLRHGDLTWLLYNGNGYGRDGFGAARLQGFPAG
jgi:hypothetical protein